MKRIAMSKISYLLASFLILLGSGLAFAKYGIHHVSVTPISIQRNASVPTTNAPSAVVTEKSSLEDVAPPASTGASGMQSMSPTNIPGISTPTGSPIKAASAAPAAVSVPTAVPVTYAAPSEQAQPPLPAPTTAKVPICTDDTQTKLLLTQSHQADVNLENDNHQAALSQIQTVYTATMQSIEGRGMAYSGATLLAQQQRDADAAKENSHDAAVLASLNAKYNLQEAAVPQICN